VALLVAATATALLAATGAGWLIASRSSEPALTPGDDDADLARFVAEFAVGLPPDAPYRAPRQAEREAAVAGIRSLFAGPDGRVARATLEPLGFAVSTGTDVVTGRRYALAVNETGSARAWGAYLVDLSRPVRLAVEVPHPNFDLGTERAGLAVFRAVPGSVLLVAGAHRRAAAGAGDVAHRTDSLFHAVAADLAGRNVPQVQLHGFHDRSLPGRDVVLSAGAGEPQAEARRAAREMAERDLAVCRAWRDECGPLAGTRNAQGRLAADEGTVFLHVEMSRSVRDNDEKQATLVRALAVVFASGEGG
jgi:hypothetical protein